MRYSDFYEFPGIRQVSAQFRRFRTSESGGMTVLILIWLLLLMPICGLAIDFTRAEHMRVRVQATLDRAVLAASDIDQTLDPKFVVLDYFAKAGLANYISADDVEVFNSSNGANTGRRVTASARGQINSSFLKLIGIETLGAPAAAGAQELITDVEVVLVLDVSGSMNSSNRLPNLKVAAREFIDTVLGANSTEGQTGIAIVPYSGQVNAGSSLLAQYSVTGDHSYGNCVNFTPAQFSSTNMAPAATILPRANVFDPWYSSQNLTLTYCPTENVRRIMPGTNQAAQLKSHITGLIASGNTSLDIGMKWGVAMIDPGFRPVNAALAAQGIVPAEFAERPFDYASGPNGAATKYIILMSDGENTDEYIIKDPYRTGLSPIYRNSSGQITIFHSGKSGTSKFFRYNNNTWSTSAYSGSTQLKWADVWASWPINWVARDLYSDPLGWNGSTRNAFISDVRGSTGPSTKNTRTLQICNAAKQQGVTVYTIGFEAPTNGKDVLRACATTPQHFFDVNGVEISTAFQVIARKISELRLTN